jgi:hypothetical protein
VIPMDLSFASSKCMGTLSNALLKSMKAVETKAFGLDSVSESKHVESTSALEHEWEERKPNCLGESKPLSLRNP